MTVLQRSLEKNESFLWLSLIKCLNDPQKFFAIGSLIFSEITLDIEGVVTAGSVFLFSTPLD
jgi:hypothetical protein